ncbi:MAG: hypothetical protein ABSF92_01760 [Candidatus Acidiferrales bacterium]|jgi:hypothetical protein
MKRSLRDRPSRRRDAGYALLLILFLGALMLIAALAAAPRVLTEGYREKEREMEWRGNQYVRGIKLCYLKTGRFPQSLEDLTKPKMGNLRFMRQAYKDPMNPDGSWRLIYVGPAGQLIGSLKPKTQGAPGSVPGQTVPGGSQAGTGTIFVPAGDAGMGGQSGAGTSAPPCGAPGGTSIFSAGAEVIGGNIIGVGSKVNRASIKILDGATNYCQWEFVWDPSKDTQNAGQAGTQVGTPVGSPIGNPMNPSPGSPSQGLPGGGQPFGNPPQQNPPQQNPPPFGQQPQN